MKKAGEILKKLLDEKGSKSAVLYSSLFRGWQDIAGISLAEHSRVYDFRNNDVLVEVDHPGWMQILHFRTRKILARLKRLYPELEINDLKIKVNFNFSAYQQHPEEEKGKKRDSDKKNSNLEVDQIIAGVKEDELKKSLKRLFVHALERERARDT